MKKIILTTLLALFSLVACNHDYTKTEKATTDEIIAYLNDKHKLTEAQKEYDKTEIEKVLNDLGDKKDIFLKAMTLKIAAKDDTSKKKFIEGLKSLELTESSFNETFDKIKGKIKEKV
ncbi:hypothetical protein F0310_04980 (plasmid) [Borrelia sp. A-FGy1]|uniref:hypothetical protein n=1 Tax=Borrelia sp. A-FGy1 TaxID=2608247 RepID=UPI0015F55D04|nr:hypothetical protein [Borrelia sp. A-FGy1]QMU99771.1 hypothetical protein F0310_04980 [Borrelia sp. A-FGy1]